MPLQDKEKLQKNFSFHFSKIIFFQNPKNDVNFGQHQSLHHYHTFLKKKFQRKAKKFFECFLEFWLFYFFPETA